MQSFMAELPLQSSALQLLTHRPLMDPQEIIDHFGCQFIIFLRCSAGLVNMAKANSPAHTLSIGMPWEERFFIMEAIDNLQPDAVREGGRVAYLALFGSRSWEGELKRVYDVLLVREHCYRLA